jgi:monothiol glutaredoxin
MSSRPRLDEARIAPAITQRMASFGRDIVDEVERAVQRDAIVVVGMAQNPFVRRVRKALTEAGLQFTYLEYGSYVSQWKQRLAIKLWSGWPTFPQVFVRGVLIGGCNETVAALGDGSLRERMDKAA